MKIRHIVPLLLFASLASCLLTSPVKKESIRAVEFTEVSLSGDLSERIGRSLSAIARVTAKGFMAGDDTSATALRRDADSFLGLVLLSRASGDTTLAARKFYNTIAPYYDAKGYPRTDDIPDEELLAGYGLLVRALCEYYKWTGESGALDMAETVCDSIFGPVADRIADYPLPEKRPAEEDTLQSATILYDGWSLMREEPGAILYSFEGIAQLYGLRPAENTRRLLDSFANLYSNTVDNPAGMSSAAFLAGMKGLLRYGEARGSTGFTGNASDAWDVFDAQALNRFYGASRIMGDSTLSSCPDASSQAFIASTWLWALTGNGDLLETAERILFNAVLPAQASDGIFAEVSATDHSDKLARCTDDSCRCRRPWVETLAAAARFSYFVRDNKVLVPFYFDGELHVATKGVKIVQTTGYPTGHTVRLEVAEAPKRGIGLQVYFPSYMTMKSMTLNGSTTVSGTVNSIGLLDLREVLRKGDVIDLTFAFGTKWTEAEEQDRRYRDMFRAVYGPLVLGYKADTVLWLERGVGLKEQNETTFALDADFSYRRDTVSGVVRVLNAIAGDDVSGTVDYTPPLFRPVYVPISAYGRGEGLPEYVLTHIARD